MPNNLRIRKLNSTGDITKYINNNDTFHCGLACSTSNHEKQSQRRALLFTSSPFNMKGSSSACGNNEATKVMSTATNKSAATMLITTNSSNNNINPTNTKRSLSESSIDEFIQSGQESQGKRNASRMWQNEIYVNPNSSLVQPQRRQTRARIGSGDRPKGFNKRYKKISDAMDVAIRLAMVFIFIKLETMKAFQRKIHLEELWLYKNPRSPDIVSPASLIVITIVGPFLTTVAHYLLTKDVRDFRTASWAWTLAVCLNGITTSILKVTVGRPRPDFYYRCFPDGVMVLNNATDPRGMGSLFNCTGNPWEINEGYKSFPSGHSSFAFVAGGFIAIYMAAKLRTFTAYGRGQAWRLCLTLAPLVWAALVAISRTCDYHHHWQDVTVGGGLGLFMAYFIYRQYYPSIFSPCCNKPLRRGECFYSSAKRRTSEGYESLRGAPGGAILTKNSNDEDELHSTIESDNCDFDDDDDSETVRRAGTLRR